MTIKTLFKPDELAIPYQLPQVPFMSPDMVIPNGLSEWLADDSHWVRLSLASAREPRASSANSTRASELTGLQ